MDLSDSMPYLLETTMSELVDTGKCVVCVLAGVVGTVVAVVGVLSLVLNGIRVMLQ